MMNQVNSNSLQAFYEAQAGLNFAYAEESRAGFSWYTHFIDDDQVRKVISAAKSVQRGTTTINFVHPVVTSIPGAVIDASGNYRVNGRNFSVKAYPEVVNNLYTGIIVIHSQATVNGITRTLEHRLSQVSPYQFLFFFPDDVTFKNERYDGRNYAGIHVNGNIRLKGSSVFSFLTSLTAGSNEAGKGYILRDIDQLYQDLAPAGQGEVPYYTEVNDPSWLNYNMRTRSNARFHTGYDYFEIGPIDSHEDRTLAYYLDADAYLGAEWKYQKYAGTNLEPVHYVVDNEDLKNLGINELAKGGGSVALFDTSKNVNVPVVGAGEEKDIFMELLDDPAVTQDEWNDFWQQWRGNHQNDYLAYHGSVINGGQDWERRFFMAAYNWPINAGATVPNAINREWWEDMEYGNDRTSVDYMSPAKREDSTTGLPRNQYFLNTEQQAAAWASWLRDNNLNTEGENKTLVKDRSQGGTYVDPGKILSKNAERNALMDKALSGGIYIGKNPATNSCVNPIADVTKDKQFYNSEKPAMGSDGNYKPSSILEIDVAALRGKIESDKVIGGALANFNGVIYVNMDDSECFPSSYDVNANGVMLVNGARVPDGGLSLVTTNNVFIKGDYNLDPDGALEKNREEDDSEVTTRYTSGVGAIGLKWQPTEIITNREVYTLSNDFPEPAYMPMASEMYDQYEDENDHIPEQNLVNTCPWWPSTESWVPTASVPEGSRLDTWFKYYRDASGNPIANPTKWADIIDGKHFSDKYFPWDEGVYYALDTDSDGKKDTYYTAEDLRDDAWVQIDDAYNSTFSYSSVHGNDPKNPSNPTTPSMVNEVTQKHIYNTTIMSPYGTEPIVLERWKDSSSRVVNGAFIQLDPDPDAGNVRSISDEASPRGVWSSSTAFRYETRFGRGASKEDRPPSGITFGASSSWREINNANF
ncbi:MAG: hypothetical protein AAB089_01310 [Nitrospirota bacterium]